MADYTITRTVSQPYDVAVGGVREALAEAGFGIITEIDMTATLKTKLGVDVADQVILGACRPALAHQAIQADPSIAAMLPCNVVVRSVGSAECVVEAFDPDAMMGFSDNEALRQVGAEARERLIAALDAVSGAESR